MAKVYDFAEEYKKRQKRAAFLHALDGAVTLVRRGEVEGMTIFMRDTNKNYPFWWKDMDLKDLEIVITKLKEVDDDKFR